MLPVAMASGNVSSKNGRPLRVYYMAIRFPDMSFQLKDIFALFSLRNKAEPDDLSAVTAPESLRNKLLMVCRDVFSGSTTPGGSNYLPEFWSEIGQMLRYRHGRPQLVPKATDQQEDTLLFLTSCPNDEFLDFIEMIFEVKCLFRVEQREDFIVEKINDILRSESANYELTPRVTKNVMEKIGSNGREVEVIKTVTEPRIMLKSTQFLHSEVVAPAIALLSNVGDFETSHSEFVKANEELRHGRYADCITTCCNSLESAIKSICKQNNWKSSGALDNLLQVLVSKKFIEPCHRKAIDSLGVIRSEIGDSHDLGGTDKRYVPTLLDARHAVHLAASNIVFLVERAKNSGS